METSQEATCPSCRRPLPQAGAPCRYCAEQSPGTFHVRPLFLGAVLVITAAFCTATVFANRFYQSKQSHLGQMWFERGQAALAAAQPRAAIQDFRNALYYSHDDPAYRLRLAEALAAADHISEAQSYLVTLWQDEPSNSTINLQLARLAVRQSRTQPALRYYHGAIYGLWPDGDAVQRRRQTRLELIHYLLSLRDNTQADAELIALTPELPHNPAAHIEVGSRFLQCGDPGHALQEFREALRLNPRAVAALRGAGEAAFQLAQYRDASEYLERALRLQPGDAKVQDLLATSRLILEWNPYARGVSSWQRAVRIVQAFRRARQRLDDCAAATGIDLTAAPTSTSLAGAPPSPGTTPSGGSKNASGLVARIFGKIKPGESASSANHVPSAATGAEMQQLSQQVTQVQRNVRAYKLERNPQLADLAMGLVSQIETATAQQCGTPKGPDLALLLLAHQADER